MVHTPTDSYKTASNLGKPNNLRNPMRTGVEWQKDMEALMRMIEESVLHHEVVVGSGTPSTFGIYSGPRVNPDDPRRRQALYVRYARRTV